MSINLNAYLKDIITIITLIITLIANTFSFDVGPFAPPDDKYPISEPMQVSESNILWDEESVFPTFTKPDGDLIAFPVDILPEREMTALACLQGFTNAVKTRVVILDSDVSKWLGDYGFSYTEVNGSNVFEYIKELCDGSVSGVILYSDELSSQYVNLASSIGNLMNALPLTAEAYEKWKSEGIDLPVVEDIRGLPYTSAHDIYKYFFEVYWQSSNHKVLVVQRPELPVQMRDLASAIGGAVVYLSCSGGAETRLFKKYLRDMTPGYSIVTGWYAGQERELMTDAGDDGVARIADIDIWGTLVQ